MSTPNERADPDAHGPNELARASTFELARWNRVEAAVDLDALPVVMVGRRSRLLGWLDLVSGAALTILAAALLMLRAAHQRAPWAAAAIGGLALSLGALLLVAGGRQLLTATVIVLDKSRVIRRTRAWVRWRDEVEPLTRFDGIVAATDEQRVPRLHALDLVHHDRRQAIRLFQTADEENLPRAWRYCCERLGVAALIDLNEDTRIVRDLDTLDRSLLDLLREGRVALPPLTPDPPAGIAFERDGEIPGLRLGDGTRMAFTRRTLQIETPDGNPGVTSIPSASIRAVAIEATARAVIVSWDDSRDPLTRKSPPLGRGLAPGSLAWLQNCLLRVVASGGDVLIALTRLVERSARGAPLPGPDTASRRA
jgi:hypothetical protein